MSRYFIDTEFIEGFHKPLFGKRRHFIDLISIGIVCEDGRTYSAISNEYKYKDADKWVQDNVIDPLYISTVHGDGRNRCNSENFHLAYGKSNKQIAEEIEWFIRRDHHVNCNTNELVDDRTHKPVEFYGYYADYDWVLFCSLFGRMIDLPNGFPMYCRDLKQMFDEKDAHWSDCAVHNEPAMPNGDCDCLKLKGHPDYPKQENEHNALADAKWNLELYNFLKRLTNECKNI
jgi:hypothetical protein